MLQQGVVDGQENPLQNMSNDSLFEVQKYGTITNYLYSASCQCVSKAFWESLSAEDQAIFDQLIAEAEESGFNRIQELEAGFRKNCEDHGMEIVDMSAEELAKFRTAMEPVYEQVKESIGQERWDKLMKYVSEVEAKL